MRAGASVEAAEREARRRLGHPLLLRDRSRDIKLLPWFEALLQDVRLGLRVLLKHRAVTGAARIDHAAANGGRPACGSGCAPQAAPPPSALPRSASAWRSGPRADASCGWSCESDLAATIGLLAGAAAGVALARFATSLLFEVTPTDVASFVWPLVALAGAAAAAAIPPALRATRVDPVVALRYE